MRCGMMTVCRSGDGSKRVDMRFEDETARLTQRKWQNCFRLQGRMLLSISVISVKKAN